VDENEISRILLPLNPSQNLDNAQEYTLWLAEVLRAQIIPLYVVPIPEDVVGMGEVTEVATVDEALKSIGANKLRSFHRKAGEVQHDPGILRRGSFVETILEVAKEEKVSLIVLPGFSSRLSRALLGSEIERIVEFSTASVLVLREKHSVPRKGQRLLIPLSGRIPRINACEQVMELASKLGLSVTFSAVSNRAEEAETLLQTVKCDWLQELPECDIDIDIDVHRAGWALDGQSKLALYDTADRDVALVVLPRVRKGAAGDTSTNLLQLFINQSTAPVLILQ
jgi:nucleotide-binding universal stress UspA family protein